MSTGQKLVTGLIAVALATTVLLPQRQTPAVLGAGLGGLSSLFSTVMGTSVPSGTQKVG